VAAWEAAAAWLIDPFFISSPSAVAVKLAEWIGSGFLLFHLSVTLEETAVGFLIGSTVGYAVGFAFGRSTLLADTLEPYVTAVYSLPKLALAPLFIMWFGIGFASKVAMSASIVFFMVFYNTYAGVRDVNPIYLNVTRLMGASEWQLMRKVILPSASAWVLTGLKVSVPYALVGAVIGEFMSANRGIGFVIHNSASIFDTAGVFAGLVVLMIVGILLNQALSRFERHTLRWKETGR
ncbi:MAG TPA: ABC transporter permease, partial [Thermodesulfobacteriota bacterium]